MDSIAKTITAEQASAAVDERGFFQAQFEAVEAYNEEPSAVQVIASRGEGLTVEFAGVPFATVEVTPEAARQAAAALLAAADYMEDADEDVPC